MNTTVRDDGPFGPLAVRVQSITHGEFSQGTHSEWLPEPPTSQDATPNPPSPSGSSSASASRVRLRIVNAATSGRDAAATHAWRPSSTSSSIPHRRSTSSLQTHYLRQRQLIETDLGGDVLGSGISEVMPPTALGAVGTQPLPPGSGTELGGGSSEVVEDRDRSLTKHPLRCADPLGRLVLNRQARPVNGRRRQPIPGRIGRDRGLDEAGVATRRHHHLPPAAIEHRKPERKVVEQLVGDDDTGAQRLLWPRRQRTNISGMLSPLLIRHLDSHIVIAPMGRRCEHGTRQSSWTRSTLHDGEVVRLAETPPLHIDPARQHCAEQRADLR